MKRLIIGGLSVLTLFAATAPAVWAKPYFPEKGVITAQTKQSSLVSAVITADETLYLDEDQTHDQELRIRNTTTVNGISLPAGSIVRGRFEPYEGGLRYVADSVRVGDRRIRLRANSDVIDARKDPRETSLGSIATDSAIGAAAGAAIGEIFGSIDLLEVLGGAAAGAVVGNVTAPTVVVIEPDTSIILYVQ
ncbi:MAG: hypothetical protein QNJ46_19760 [Leptolyngbyaceae cyanobacterium MO_188.B28]|nr:hypothetical protein [Leptolyngbyaceae cyanobacterium MO_188.B28]